MALHELTLDSWVVIGILVVEIIDFVVTRLKFWKEYEFDRSVYEKKQRRTKTTKKTVTLPSDDVVTEENTESIESKGEK